MRQNGVEWCFGDEAACDRNLAAIAVWLPIFAGHEHVGDYFTVACWIVHVYVGILRVRHALTELCHPCYIVYLFTAVYNLIFCNASPCVIVFCISLAIDQSSLSMWSLEVPCSAITK